MTKQRRFCILFLLLPLLLGLTSCIRYRVEYDIVDKEHVKLNWNIGVRKPENGIKAPEDLTVENICKTVVEHAQTQMYNDVVRFIPALTPPLSSWRKSSAAAATACFSPPMPKAASARCMPC